MARSAVLNLSDVPEVLPGARPGANPAQREEFERRSRRVYEDGVAECSQEWSVSRAAVGAAPTSSDFAEMFPELDPILVQALRAEAPSAQHALETLLALAAATAESLVTSPVGRVDARMTTWELPKKNVGIEDHNKFPTLLDADGWQVPAARLGLHANDEDLGSAWRDCAQAAADKLAPECSSQRAVVWGTKKRQDRQKHGVIGEEAEPLTDYECRHHAGERRAKHRVLYGRGGKRGGGTPDHGLGDGLEEREMENAWEEEVDSSQI